MAEEYQDWSTIWGVGNNLMSDTPERGITNQFDLLRAKLRQNHPELFEDDQFTEAVGEALRRDPKAAFEMLRRGVDADLNTEQLKSMVTPLKVKHEQSETIQNKEGKWINVYGKELPNAGQQLPGTRAYGNKQDAIAAAKKRSESGVMSAEEFAGDVKTKSMVGAELSFEDFSGTKAPGTAKPKMGAKQALEVGLNDTVRNWKQMGGEAAAVADLILSIPGFVLNVGAQLGGTVQAAARGVPLTADKRQLNPVTAYTVGREAGREFSEPFMNPLHKLMQMFKSGEAYENAATSKGMEKLTNAIEAAGNWTEDATGGRVSRDAIPMLTESLMASATALGGKKGAIDPVVQKRIRESAVKLREQAEAAAQRRDISFAEFEARVPVQEQINEMLGIRTPQQQAKITRQRRKDIQAAFREPAEGSDFVDIGESQFRAGERISNEAAFAAEAEKGRIGGTAYEPGAAPRPERVGQAEVLRIMQKPGWERTAEDLITLRAARQEGKATPEAAMLLGSAGIGAVVGAELDDNALRGAALGGATAMAPFALLRGLDAGGVRSRMKQSGAVKEPGGMWHPEAVERLGTSLTEGLNRGMPVEEMARRLADNPHYGGEGKLSTPEGIWAAKAVKNYLNKYAGTARDPLKDVEIPYAGGVKRWEEVMDRAVTSRTAGRLREDFINMEKPGANPEWLPDRVPAEERIFEVDPQARGTSRAIADYLSHVGDYLRQNVDPAKLKDYDLTRAVRETFENDKRVAKQMEKATADSTKSLPVHKEYPDGFKWVELKLPEKLTPEQEKQVRRPTESEIDSLVRRHDWDREHAKLDTWLAVGPDGKPINNSYTGDPATGTTPREAWLAGRLAEEGNIMGHCVGGYCEGVASGESRIFSLRDPKGKSHVTIEVEGKSDVRTHDPRKFVDEVPEARKKFGNFPGDNAALADQRAWNQEVMRSEEFGEWLKSRPKDVIQIKGKQNRAPNKEYLPYVQDFVKEGKWGEVGDLAHSGMVKMPRLDTPIEIGKRFEYQYVEPKVAKEALLNSLARRHRRDKTSPAQAAYERKGIEDAPDSPEGAYQLQQSMNALEHDVVMAAREGKDWLSNEDLLKRANALHKESAGRLPSVTAEDVVAFRRGELEGPGVRTLQEAEQLGKGEGLRGHYGTQRGFVDQKLVAGISTIGLGGIAGSLLSEDPVSGALLGALAGAALHLPGVKRRLKDAAEAADYGIGVISTRIGNVSPALRQRARLFEMRSLTEAHARLHRVVPFMQELERVPATRRAELDRAILTNDRAKIAELIRGNRPLVDAWREARNVLNEIGEELQGHGRFKSMKDDYFPRLVKDLEGLKGVLGRVERGRLEQALAEAEREAMRVRGTPLTHVEVSAIVNKQLYSQGRAKGYQPGFAKGRTVEEVTEQLRPFYFTPSESLYTYVRGAVADLETAKFFGRDLAQIERGNGKFIDLDTSVGNVVGRELMEGKITPDQAQQLINMLQSRFRSGERASNRLIQDVRNMGNMGLLGNIVAGVTQGADALMALYAHDFRSTMSAMTRQITGKERVTPRDFGLADHVAEEFSSVSRTANWLDKMFKYSGFSAIDRFGKSTHLNAALAKYERWSRTPEGVARIREKYGEAYGRELPDLITDLRQGAMTERVRSLLFSELSDMQPISKLELPQGYLDNPNGRLIYMLKTFMLKQMDVVRRDMYGEIKKGNVGRGLKNATEYSLILGLSGASTQMIKDWLLGKDVRFDASDVLENVLKTFAWSEYTREKVRQGKPVEAMVGAIMPPYRMMDDIIRRDPKAVQYIPLVGKLYHSWELGGREEAELRDARKAKKEGREVNLSGRAEAYRERKREKARERRENR